MPEIIIVPTVLFLVIVAPVWLILHYRYKTKMAGGLSDREHGSIDNMLEALDKLSERIETLEKILDAKNASWRAAEEKEAKGE